MPKPLFPPHAGPYPPAFKPSAPPTSGADARSTHPSAASDDRQALEAEIERLRQELAAVQDRHPPEVRFAFKPIPMIWTALALCAAALLFAVAAVLRHG